MIRIKKNNFKTLGKMEIISSTLILSVFLSSCSSYDEDVTETITTTIEQQIESQHINETSIVNTVQSTLNTSEETLNTSIYSCPIPYEDSIGEEFSIYLSNKYGHNMCDDMTVYGLDNRFLNQTLNEFLRDEYGITDGNYTIDNFHYFEFLKYHVLGFPYNGFSSLISGLESTQGLPILVRSTLIEQDLRFLIDEIPYSYFEERFPEFMSNIENYEYRHQLQDKMISLVENRKITTNMTLNQLSQLSDYEYDLLLFWELRNYNNYRNSLLREAEVVQVRDQDTGRHVLVPDRNQLRRMENIMDDFEGYDFTITEPESREHFYQSFGCYPEDVVNENRIYEGNKSSERSR